MLYVQARVRPYILSAKTDEKAQVLCVALDGFRGAHMRPGVANIHYAAKKVKEGLVFFCKEGA